MEFENKVWIAMTIYGIVVLGLIGFGIWVIIKLLQHFSII